MTRPGRPSRAEAPVRRRPLRAVAWAVFAAADLAVLLAVAVGLAAAFLPPRAYWWAQLVAIGLPYATWALVALTVVVLAGRQWTVVALHLVLIGLVAVRALPPSRFAEPVVSDGDLALTTFNVPQVGPSREVLGDSVVAFVGRAQPDVLALQDAWVFAPRRERSNEEVQVEAVRQRLGYSLAVPARLAGYPGWRENGTGVPILIRDASGVDVVEQEALIVGVERDADVSLALRTQFRWGGREAVLYNVHLRSFGAEKPWNDSRVRLTQPATWAPYLRRYRTVYAQRGAEVAEIAEQIEEETLPVIVVGDFNSTADNWSYRRLRRAGGVSRQDAFRDAGGLAWGRTYRSDKPFVRIDFVLVDPAFEVTAARTADVTFSDHRPVRVRLRWREAAASGP